MGSVSVIINNFNYGRFLGKAIDSVLAQTVAPLEIIVVDDGSTDNSLQVAGAYGDSIKLVSKKNGGQGSAYNAGYAWANGDWIWFLDADDHLQPDAIEQVSKLMGPGISKIHGKLICINEHGVKLNKLTPRVALSKGIVLDELYIRGTYRWPPGSGNIYPRDLLVKCMPIPEEKFRLFADLYLCTHAAFYGEIVATDLPLGSYRLHSSNNFSSRKLDSQHLTSQAKNLWATIDLLEELFGKLYNKIYHYPFTRWNYETLLLAKRFTHEEGITFPSYEYLQKAWEQTPEIKAMVGFTKNIYRIYWFVLRYMPKFFIESILTIKR